MENQQKPSNLGQLLDLLDNADYEDSKVSWGEIMEVVGSRSFGRVSVSLSKGS